MSYPDFTLQGYQVVGELGRNREGGRIAWLALDLQQGQQVVIKQFCFAQSGSDWSAYQEHEREIQVLKGLNHPGIPKYLGALATKEGFCLIQEYKNAPNLAVHRSFDPEEIKQIAVKVLKILVYLQNRIPVVIHRDIKPENILVDEQINVYLIDFGMSRIGSQEVSASSVFKGTPGFIPPEQLHKPTTGSDLYGLGATLICLLTGIKSTQMSELTDDDDPYTIHFRHLLPKLSGRFLHWLELMVKPRLKERFADAQTALDALRPLDVVRVPKAELSKSKLEFTASRCGEILTETITVDNLIPDTVLQGTWEIAPHPQDMLTWICVEPIEFSRNHIQCRVQVDTSKLMVDELYQRHLLLHTNADPEIYAVAVRVQTAPLLIELQKVPIILLAVIFFNCAFISLVMSWALAVDGFEAVMWTIFRVLVGAIVGAEVGAIVGAEIGAVVGLMITAASGAIAASGAVLGALAIAFLVVGTATNKSIVTQLPLLTAGLGISCGIAYLVGIFHPYVLLGLAGTGLPLLTLLIYLPYKRRRLITQYRQSEENLIKP